MRSRIAWTPSEEQLIVSAACNILEKEPYMLSQLQLLQRAMKAALFPERIRPIKFVSTVKWFKPRVKAEMAARATKQKTETTFPTAVTAVEPTGLNRKDALQVSPVPKTAADLTTDELLGEIMKRLFFKPLGEEIAKYVESSHLIARLSSEIVAGTRGMSVFNEMAKKNAVQEAKKKKVLVVGLLNEQKQTIAKLFGDFFDLRFCEGNTPNLAQVAQNSNVCVLMTKFTSHSTQNTLKSVGANIIFCDGGVTNLEQILEGVFDRG